MSRSFGFFVVFVSLLGSSFPIIAAADESSEFRREVRHYEGKLLLLPTPSRFDLIHYDANGRSTRQSTGEPWTTAGLVLARKIDYRDRQIAIDGERAVVVLEGDSPAKKLTTAAIGRDVHVVLEVPATIHNVADLNAFLLRAFSGEGLEAKINGAWRADIDLNTLSDFRSIPADGRVGTLENGRIVYCWESNVVTQPKALYKPGPSYSASALTKRVSGTVHVRVIVNERGFPEILELIDHLPEGMDAGVLSAVSQWRFQPGFKDGMPTPTVVIVEIRFKLTPQHVEPRRPRK